MDGLPGFWYSEAVRKGILLLGIVVVGPGSEAILPAGAACSRPDLAHEGLHMFMFPVGLQSNGRGDCERLFVSTFLMKVAERLTRFPK